VWRISSPRFVNPRKCDIQAAGLETGFRKIQSLCDVTITEALASQVIHRA
jgi:hypothetical protein